MSKVDFISVLKSEMIPALGCTEPAAAALAGARAAELLEGDAVNRIEVEASHDMIKNAMGVSIPGFGSHGLAAAVSLGAAVADSSKELSILVNLDEKNKKDALGFKVSLKVADDAPSLYVSARIVSENGKSSCAVISGEHNRFVYLEQNGKVLLDDRACEKTDSAEKNDIMGEVTLSQIIDFAEKTDIGRLGFIKEAIDNNLVVAKAALEGDFGLNTGRTTLPEQVRNLSDAYRQAASFAAAASDARMSGCSMPVIINSGSGNQGITVTVPVAIVASFLKSGEEKLVRAVCISELVGLALTYRKSRLSALCGAFTASIGTACAYVYLLGGTGKAYDRVIANMVGNMSGIICDGAKSTCALKIYSCLECAALSTSLALAGYAPGAECGIVGENSLECIEHLFKISSEGMIQTDRTIFDIMTAKKC